MAKALRKLNLNPAKYKKTYILLLMQKKIYIFITQLHTSKVIKWWILEWNVLESKKCFNTWLFSLKSSQIKLHSRNTEFETNKRSGLFCSATANEFFSAKHRQWWEDSRSKSIHLQRWVHQKILKAQLVTFLRWVSVYRHLVFAIDGIRFMETQAEVMRFRSCSAKENLWQNEKRLIITSQQI